MNLDRYEKVNGREALKRLADGERIHLEHGCSYEIGTSAYPSVKKFVGGRDRGAHDWESGQPLTILDVCDQDWYIPKPFDVRQAMLDRPNEWVGAYESYPGQYYKVGFDTNQFMAIDVPFQAGNDCKYESGSTGLPIPTHLDYCIPIEDVPEEATR